MYLKFNKLKEMIYPRFFIITPWIVMIIVIGGSDIWAKMFCLRTSNKSILQCKCDKNLTYSSIDDNTIVLNGISNSSTLISEKIKTDIVMFVPTPIPWEHRRQAVHKQFEREGWTQDRAVLLFVYGNRSGVGLRDEINTSGIVEYPSAKNIIVYCRDQGDEFNNPDDTSGTTCKVYEALKYIVKHYESKYVWRGADDSYVNLRFFFSNVMPSIPTSRLFLGRLRRTDTPQDDLMLHRQPELQRLLGIYQFGQYMYGMGFVFSYDVADFIASLKIPPHLTWCEDVMVGMWLLPFQISFMDYPGFLEQYDTEVEVDKDYVLIHRMTPEQWQQIGEKGRLV